MSSQEPPVRSDAWTPWRIARLTASAIVLMLAAYYLVVAFDNITDPINPNASNWPFVKGVLSGAGTPADSGFEYRFINVGWVQALAYIAIIAAETIAGLLLLIGGALGLRRGRDAPVWDKAQRWTFAGAAVGLLLFFFGFITIGGNWFIMYLNSKWNGLMPAFQNSVMTITTLLLVVGVMVGGALAGRDD